MKIIWLAALLAASSAQAYTCTVNVHPDSSGVQKVVWTLDGVSQHTTTTAPYSWVGCLDGVPPGPHRIVALVTDVDGLSASTASAFTVAAATTPVPATVTGAFTAPANASTVSGIVPVSIATTGAVKQVLVEWWSGATGTHELKLLASPPWSWSWDTSALPPGHYLLSGIVWRSSGGYINIKRVSISVVPPPATTPPPVTVPSAFKGTCKVQKITDAKGGEHIIIDCTRTPK